MNPVPDPLRSVVPIPTSRIRSAMGDPEALFERIVGEDYEQPAPLKLSNPVHLIWIAALIIGLATGLARFSPLAVWF